MGALTTRTRILKIWSTTYGLTLTPEALSWLEALVDQFGLSNTADDEAVAEFHKAMERMAASHTEDVEDYSQIVTADHLEAVYARLQALEGNDAAAEHHRADSNNEDANNIDPSTHIRIIDAFDMPWLHFDGEKRMFVHHANIASTSGTAAGTSAARKLPSIGAAADSKAAYLRDRYNILKQIILRNEHFSPPALPGHDRENYMKLTSIKNLLGRQGGHFLLFGMLTRLEDGAFALEDLDAQIVLDISEASPASGMFTEGCFALVDGQYTLDSIFKVSEIGHPPSETRADSRSIYGHVDFLGTGALTLSEEEKLRESEKKHPDQFLVFSDLHLDSPKDLSQFRKVLQAYESFLADRPPALCIICGNFASKPVKLMDGKSLKEYQSNFSAFADLILSYPRCARDMHFVFVPGPTDPYDVTGAILPRRGLPNSLVKDIKAKIPKVSFPSNPCRITYKSQEIVIMREDLMSRMLRNTVRLKADLSSLANQQLAEENTLDGMLPLAKGDGRRRILSQFLVQTILDQSHLAPFPLSVRPVLWEFDQALRLFPLPTTVILADKYLPYEVTYEDCHVFNPGGFAGSNYTWSAYQTGDRRSEQSGFE